MGNCTWPIQLQVVYCHVEILNDTFSDRLFRALQHLLKMLLKISSCPFMVPYKIDIFTVIVKLLLAFILEQMRVFI